MNGEEVEKFIFKKLLCILVCISCFLFMFSKYYLDVKRREDAFDLSGPYLPKEDPTPLRAVSKTSRLNLIYVYI
jgi:hypothetical protein